VLGIIAPKDCVDHGDACRARIYQLTRCCGGDSADRNCRKVTQRSQLLESVHADGGAGIAL
jgi:hypothetical protein